MYIVAVTVVVVRGVVEVVADPLVVVVDPL